jgi:acylphosphatase
MKAFRAEIFGRVQGVAFRYSTREKAEELGLKGWVKNNFDGTVSVHFEGTEEAIEEMKEWLKKGSSLANVRRINFNETEIKGFEKFEIEI